MAESKRGIVEEEFGVHREEVRDRGGDRRLGPLPQWDEQIPFHPVRHPGKLFLRELQEVGRGAMRLEGSIIPILLINKKSARLGLVAVHDVHGASRLLA